MFPFPCIPIFCFTLQIWVKVRTKKNKILMSLLSVEIAVKHLSFKENNFEWLRHGAVVRRVSCENLFSSILRLPFVRKLYHMLLYNLKY